mmetsp:Transcript_36062/g.92920  ORF Transcript_36062/g.92920 Transcript_36062/m.92920 type:complete len:374 (-) Transcript_36062:159-1280(-)
MGSPVGNLSMMENPQALDGDETPGGHMWPGAGPWDQEGMGMPDFGNVHAVSATTAAYHADVAAKHAASLAQWVQYLSGTLGALQHKVTELEDWKKRALEDVRKLREEHKVLRRKVLGEERHLEDPGVGVPKSRSTPLMPSSSSALMEEVDQPPPGFETLPNIPEKGVSMPDIGSKRGQPDLKSQVSDLSVMTSFSIRSENSMAFSDIVDTQLEGVTVTTGDVNGTACERAEWRIGHLSTRLRGCMGRALVSSAFNAAGLEDLRLMICPDGKDAAKGPRSRRQKELYAKKVMDGPFEGCLKLKVPNCGTSTALKYYLKVGSVRCGPFKHDFAESTVSGYDDFGIDWLKQLEPDASLTVCVEITQAPGMTAETSA